MDTTMVFKETTSSSKMTNSIDHILKNIIQMRPKFILPELMKDISCVVLGTTKKLERKGVHRIEIM